MTSSVQEEGADPMLGVALTGPGSTPSGQAATRLVGSAGTIPNAETEAFIALVAEPLEAMVRKFTDDAYGVILYNLQDYLRENAVYNIKAAFDAQERDRVTAYQAMRAIESAQSLHEARQHAYAARKGYWRVELTDQFRAEASAIEARSGETGTGSIGAADESAVAKPDAQRGVA